MLAHRLQRWPNINPALGQHLVFAGHVPAGFHTSVSSLIAARRSSDWWRSLNDFLEKEATFLYAACINNNLERTLNVGSMWIQCWANVLDVVPAFSRCFWVLGISQLLSGSSTGQCRFDKLISNYRWHFCFSDDLLQMMISQQPDADPIYQLNP